MSLPPVPESRQGRSSSNVRGQTVPRGRTGDADRPVAEMSSGTRNDSRSQRAAPVDSCNVKSAWRDGDTQTLRAGRSKVEPKILPPPLTPFRERRTAKI